MLFNQMSRFVCILSLIFVAAMVAGSATPASASVCTLADRIRSANTNTAVGFCPGGTSQNIITITEDITLTEALPPITGTITIEGGGHAISGDEKFRIFDVDGSGNLTIKNLTLTDGFSDRQFGGAIRIGGGSEVVISHSTLANNSAVYGGAISQRNQRARLTVEDSSFLNNRAEWHAGAIEIVGGTAAIKSSSFQENYSDDYGGVITVASNSRTRIENSTFYKNSAKHNAGVAHGLGGEITLIHVTMVNNFLTNPYGNSGNTITKQAHSPGDSKSNLRNSIIAGRGGQDCFGGLDQLSGNLSTDGSCAYKRSGAPRLGALTGSPAYLPLLDQSPAVDTANPEFCLETDQIGRARPQGGGCDIGAIESTTATPAPTPTPTICNLQDQIIAANTDRAYRSCPAGNGADTIYLLRDFTLSEPLATIRTDITIDGNGHTIDGVFRFRIFDVDGGRLTINNVTLANGTGAIRLQNGGQVFVNDSSFVRNTAQSGGAIEAIFAVYVEVNNSSFISNGAGYRGGAISMIGGGVANIKNSSFVDNFSEYEGGAIDTVSGTLTVSNSSFIGNRAGHGGTISAAGNPGSGYAPVRLTHLTMLDNSASKGAALHLDDSPHTKVAIRLRNSVLAGNVARGRQLCSARLTQNLHNLIEDGSCSPLLTGDPMFKEADESATMVLPKSDSPLVDAGYPEVCLDADQIGRPRPLGFGCDIGAIEAMPAAEARSDCVVTTTQELNLRDGPNGNRVGIVPLSTAVVAEARTAQWFKVEYQGATGWISAEHARTRGVCG